MPNTSEKSMTDEPKSAREQRIENIEASLVGDWVDEVSTLDVLEVIQELKDALTEARGRAEELEAREARLWEEISRMKKLAHDKGVNSSENWTREELNQIPLSEKKDA